LVAVIIFVLFCLGFTGEMKLILFALISLVALSTVYAEDSELSNPNVEALDVEDPYSMSKPKMMKSKMMKPKMMKPKMMKPKMMKPKTMKPKHMAKPKHAAHSSTGAHVNNTHKQPAVVTSGLCTYTVKSGDTLSGIGGRVGVSWQSLAAQNHLANPNLIHPGQVLSYACGSAPAPPPSNPTPPPSAPSGGQCKPFADAHWNCATAACTSHVSSGAYQPAYECAEFVARSLASAGRIPGLSSDAPQGSYAAFHYNGAVYDLCWTSSRYQNRLGLEDFLKAAGWSNSGANLNAINDCSVVFAESYGHVGVGVGNHQLDAHNVAHIGWAVSNWAGIISTVYNH